MAEFEFPAYFNFFVLKRRLTLIVTEETEACVRTVFQETLLGPKVQQTPLPLPPPYGSCCCCCCSSLSSLRQLLLRYCSSHSSHRVVNRKSN